jgi:hypothetical protein
MYKLPLEISTTEKHPSKSTAYKSVHKGKKRGEGVWFRQMCSISLW